MEVALSINKAINSYTAKTSKPITDEIVTKRYVNHCGLLKFRGNREQTAYLSWNDWTILQIRGTTHWIREARKRKRANKLTYITFTCAEAKQFSSISILFQVQL